MSQVGIRDFSFSTTDGSATVKMTFGVICACVGFEDCRPSISTTVLGMNLRCAENDNVQLNNRRRIIRRRKRKVPNE